MEEVQYSFLNMYLSSKTTQGTLCAQGPILLSYPPELCTFWFFSASPTLIYPSRLSINMVFS